MKIITNISNNIRCVGGDILRYQRLDIGVWNMDTTPTIDVTHNLTFLDIIHISVLIERDDSLAVYNLISPDGSGNAAGGIALNTTDVKLYATVGGFFDGASYVSAVLNRGHVYIVYRI